MMPKCRDCGKELTRPEYSVAFEGMYFCLGCAEKQSSRGKTIWSNTVQVKLGDIVKMIDGEDSMILGVEETQ